MTPFLETSNMDVQGFEIWAASGFSQIISEQLFLCPNCITNQEQNPIPLQTYMILLNIWGFVPPQASTFGQ